MKNGIHFIVIAILVADLFKILIYANLDDLWRQSDAKWQNMEYLCKCKMYGIEILQGWCAATATDFDCGYDVTIETYSLPDLYPPKIKTALFIAAEFNRLSCACAV